MIIVLLINKFKQMKEQKTKVERFLGDGDILKRLKTNIKNSYNFTYSWYISHVGNMPDAISGAFFWSESNEGYEFWERLDKNYRDVFDEL